MQMVSVQVLNETMLKGKDPQDGAGLSSAMWNRTFKVLGKDVRINSNGDQESEWALHQIHPDTGLIHVSSSSQT